MISHCGGQSRSIGLKDRNMLYKTYSNKEHRFFTKNAAKKQSKFVLFVAMKLERCYNHSWAGDQNGAWKEAKGFSAKAAPKSN